MIFGGCRLGNNIFIDKKWRLFFCFYDENLWDVVRRKSKLVYYSESMWGYNRKVLFFMKSLVSGYSEWKFFLFLYLVVKLGYNVFVYLNKLLCINYLV